MLTIEEKETIQLIQYVNSSQGKNSKDEYTTKNYTYNWEYIYNVLKKNGMLAFTADIMSEMTYIDNDLLSAWKNDILMIITRNIQNRNTQSRVVQALKGRDIRLIIVKGTTAAKYYPNPLYRMLGDIDLLIYPDDYDKACNSMIEIGALERTTTEEFEFGRHRVFLFNSFLIEIHKFIATIPGTKEADIIDSLAYSCAERGDIYADDLTNGIIILDHIKKHLRGEGIGLRQIMDWNMFVNKCVDDETWDIRFRDLTERTGLRTLAITLTDMCSRYFGLSKSISWCQSADRSLVDELLSYVIQCGNFGAYRLDIDKWSITDVLQIRHSKRFFSYLQKQGLKKWNLAKKYAFLKPFAWLYQIARWFHLGIKRGITPSVLAHKMERESQIKKMMKNLEII